MEPKSARRLLQAALSAKTYYSCGQGYEAFGDGLDFVAGWLGAESRVNLLPQQFPPPRAPSVGVAGPSARIVPRTYGPIHQLLCRAFPRPCLGQGERPQADVECTDARPHEPHLLLARPDVLLAVAEGRLQRKAVGDRH